MTLEEFNQKLALAERGDAQAQNDVAYAYINKQCESVEKDLAKGFEWFLKSAEQGQLNSMVNVGGWCYLNGYGTTRDCEKAVYWMERAIEAGASDEWSLNAYATALNNYGWELYDGIHNDQRFGATKDVDKAAVLFRKASETGRMSYATANLGNCYHTGQGVEKDLHKAKELYDKAVAEGLMNDVLKGWMESLDEELAKETQNASFSGNSGFSAFGGMNSVVPEFERQRQEEEARKAAAEREQAEIREKTKLKEECESNYQKGIAYLTGIDAPLSPERAVKFLQSAAEQGYAPAKFKLAEMQEVGDVFEKDVISAVEVYIDLAKSGYAEAQCKLAKCYEEGIGVAKNTDKMIEWLTKAAEQGNATVQKYLGDCHYKERNSYSAKKWYTKAAEQGVKDAAMQFRLGFCYFRIKDYSSAVEWFTKAAEQGHAEAQAKLASCYIKGHGVTQDYDKAMEWYTKAAKQGYYKAMKMISDCYKYGYGVTQDDAEAKKWHDAYEEARLSRLN